MNVVNLYRKIKQIFNDSNVALASKGLSEVDNLYQIPNKLSSIKINRLPYALNRSIMLVTEDDLRDTIYIPNYAFYDCYNLTSVTIPDSVTRIGNNAFASCHSLQSVVIPDGVIEIYSGAFASCHSLQSVVIPDSVTTIGYSAFHLCTSLTSVTIPDSVTSIVGRAFASCISLTDIYLNSTTPPSLGDTGAIPTTTTIHVPIGSGEAYRNATNWSYHSDRIVEDVEV